MLKMKVLVLAMVLAAGLVFSSGCESVDEGIEVEEPAGGEETSESAGLSEPDGTVVVTDQMGREIIIEEVPQRIISLSPSNTEVLFALGLEERIVGVTDFCNYPPEALEKDSIGGFSTPSIERIVELEPDFILASTIHEEEVPRLEELGLAVMVIESSDLVGLYQNISLVAEVTGIAADGEALIASMQERIQAVESVVAEIAPEDRVKVYYEVYSDPLMSAGSGALITEIIALAGGINIFGDVDENYPQISAEVVAEKQPDIIMFPDYHGTADIVLESMADRAGWENVPAIQEDRVYAASDDTFARPGPRIADAVEEAARIFYPELF